MVTSEIWVLRFYRSKTLQEFESGEYGNRTQKLVDLFAKEGVTISTLMVIGVMNGISI